MAEEALRGKRWFSKERGAVSYVSANEVKSCESIETWGEAWKSMRLADVDGFSLKVTSGLFGGDREYYAIVRIIAVELDSYHVKFILVE